MSRVDEIRTKYEVELALAELEDRLVEQKGRVERCSECGRRSAADSPDLRDLKLEVREARRAHRAEREGGVVAAPEVIEVTTSVDSPGGEG